MSGWSKALRQRGCLTNSTSPENSPDHNPLEKRMDLTFVVYSAVAVMTLVLVGLLARWIHRRIGRPVVAVLTFILLTPVAFVVLLGMTAFAMMIIGTLVEDALR